MIRKFFIITICLSFIIAAAVETNIFGAFFKSSTAFAVGDLVVDWGGGVLEGQPIFTVSNMAPGQSVSHTVTVKNNASSIKPVGVRGNQTTFLNGLENNLILTISQGTTLLYGPKTLNQFYADSLTSISLSSLNPGATTNYTFKVLLDQSAGNDAQSKDLSFDLHMGIAIATPAECSNIAFSGSPIFGTDRPDVLNGTSGNDLIFGFDGPDLINGKGGDDCIISGAGADFVNGGSGNDVIFGGEGTDTLNGEAGNDKLFGEKGNDFINGAAGTDSCLGESKINCEL